MEKYYENNENCIITIRTEDNEMSVDMCKMLGSSTYNLIDNAEQLHKN